MGDKNINIECFLQDYVLIRVEKPLKEHLWDHKALQCSPLGYRNYWAI